MSETATLPGLIDPTPRTRWFGLGGCVYRREDGVVEVFVGGMLLGAFGPDDVASRNVVLVLLVEDPRTRVGELARAFEITPEIIRRARRLKEEQGLLAVASIRGRGAPSKRSPRLCQRLQDLFKAGVSIQEAYRRVRKHVSYGTVWNLHREWKTQQSQSANIEQSPATTRQQELPISDAQPANDSAAPSTKNTVAATERQLPETKAKGGSVSCSEGDGADLETAGDEVPLEHALERGGSHVQHIGTWLMLGMLQRMGLYSLAARFANSSVEKRALRVALDAVAIALSLGQGCIEGVRRLATPSAATLLRSSNAPSASWVRRVLHGFADSGASM